MAANAFPGEIGDGPISRYFCIYVFYVCAKFHTCIIKRTIHSHIVFIVEIDPFYNKRHHTHALVVGGNSNYFHPMR